MGHDHGHAAGRAADRSKLRWALLVTVTVLVVEVVGAVVTGSLALLADAGVAMVIYPVTLLRSAMGAAERVLHAIKEEGTQQSQVEQMLTRARLYELVDYEGYNAFDTGIFNFDVPTLDIGANHADL